MNWRPQTVSTCCDNGNNLSRARTYKKLLMSVKDSVRIKSKLCKAINMRGLIIAIALAALLATAYAGHQEHHQHHYNYVLKTREDLIKYRNHCVEKVQVPGELVEKFKKWDFPDDEKTRCYLKCVFEQFGLFDEKKGFDVHKIHHQLAGVDAVHPGHVDHDDETHKKIENCVDNNSVGSDKCTWAYRGATCFMRHNLSLVKQSLNP